MADKNLNSGEGVPSRRRPTSRKSPPPQSQNTKESHDTSDTSLSINPSGRPRKRKRGTTAYSESDPDLHPDSSKKSRLTPQDTDKVKCDLNEPEKHSLAEHKLENIQKQSLDSLPIALSTSISDWLSCISSVEEDEESIPVPDTVMDPNSAQLNDDGEPSVTSTSRTKRPLVLASNSYRKQILGAAGVELRNMTEDTPSHIGSLYRRIMYTGRKSPGPTAAESFASRVSLAQLDDGALESEVITFLCENILPKAIERKYSKHSGFNIASDTLMKRCHLPVDSNIPLPKPNRLMGYDTMYGNDNFKRYRDEATKAGKLHKTIQGFDESTKGGNSFPFFVIECKSASTTSGGMPVAANQAFGGMIACLNIVRHLNDRLNEQQGDGTNHPRIVNSIVFGMTLDYMAARIYVGWINDDPNVAARYIIQTVDSFLLEKEPFISNLRFCIRNIMDWARDERRPAIAEALRAVLDGTNEGQ